MVEKYNKYKSMSDFVKLKKKVIERKKEETENGNIKICRKER